MSSHSSTQLMSRRHFLWLTSMSAAGLATGCAIDPITGQRQLMLVSRDTEIKIDQQQSPYQFSTDYGLSRDQSLNAYVNEVGQQLIPYTHRPDMPYSFRTVNATYINAYAFPGGSIALTRGILLKLDNEAELSALLGHEVGHVNARHTAEQLSKNQVVSALVGGITAVVSAKYSQYANLAQQLGMLSAGALLAHYSRDNEREADALGNEYMIKSGYSTLGFIGLMDMLNSLSSRSPGYADVLFSTHPMSQERYQAAVDRATTVYQQSKSLPLNRDRYMDRIARLRAISDAIDAMQKAEAAMGKNDFDQASSLLKGALRAAPDDYAGLAMMAKCQIAMERFREAERYAAEAQQAYPGEAQAHLLGGFAKLQRERFSSAYQEFNNYDRILPGNPNTAFFKGFCLEGMNRRREAAEHYGQYLQVVQKGPKAEHAYKSLVAWGYIKQ